MSTLEGEPPEVDEQHVIDRLNEFGVRLDPEIDYRLSSLFPQLEGWGAKAAIKAKHKLIGQIEPHLKTMLHQGEEVLYIAKGTQYSFAEHYFMGIWAMSINQTVFVLTNARLLMMRTNSKGRPKETFWVLYYSQIDTFKGSWTGVLQLKLRDGKKLKFTGFPKVDRKTMPEVFEQALDQYRQLGFDPEVSQSLENLCCGCFQAVPKGVYECADCGITYWKPTEVALRSLVVPSWGDVVLKHYLIAGLEMFGGFITWMLVVGLVLVYLQEGDPFVLFGAVFLLLMFHGTDAAITYYVAKKGLHPKRRERVRAE